MISLRIVGNEVTALGAAALATPLRPLLWRDEVFDPEAPHPTPTVLVHGFFGDPTNFLTLRGRLAARGIRNFVSFSYPPRFDYQRLAPRLGRTIEAVCLATGAEQVDVIGHSLGGLIARYLIEMGDGGRVRRLVTLGAPYFASRIPPREFAIFGAYDPFIPAPHPIYGPHGHTTLVPDCGHWGLLYHPTVFEEVTRYLVFPPLGLVAPPRALDVAS
jgi:pimeloyl-ACP methyl ester carboxylesterase